jgi:hypothetical protein
MSTLPRKDGLFQLERTGPFVPPISMPFEAIVVTEEFRNRIEESALTGIAFQPVIKTRIVNLEWQKWDRAAEEPEEYPSTGEPEDYILERSHSPELAEKIGNLWEVCLEEHAEAIRVPRDPSKWGLKKWAFYDAQGDIFIVLSSWDGFDFFKAKAVGYTYVSERAKNWLEHTVSEWVGFEPAPTK